MGEKVSKKSRLHPPLALGVSFSGSISACTRERVFSGIRRIPSTRLREQATQERFLPELTDYFAQMVKRQDLFKQAFRRAGKQSRAFGGTQ